MITKAQATTIATSTAIAKFQTDVAAAIEAAALAGVVGITNFPYPASATVAQVNAWTAARQADLWTVTTDTVNHLVTLS